MLMKVRILLLFQKGIHAFLNLIFSIRRLNKLFLEENDCSLTMNNRYTSFKVVTFVYRYKNNKYTKNNEMETQRNIPKVNIPYIVSTKLPNYKPMNKIISIFSNLADNLCY